MEPQERSSNHDLSNSQKSALVEKSTLSSSTAQLFAERVKNWKPREMDRNEGIVRWSPNSSRDEFMTFNLNNKVVSLYKATGHARPDRFDYSAVSRHSELPPVNTYDWSPAIRGLVSVGTVQGIVYLLRVDDGSHAHLTLPLKLQRCVQSVAFNTTGLLAVGLDRVRNDSCLQIWDVNQRLADWDSTRPGWNLPAMNIEPKVRLEGSTSVSSIRFYEDQPQSLICGIRGQSVRIHDLRDPNSAVITFQTKCNNNIAIDWLDTNYFASSTLDQPGFIVWDRRASQRSSASPMYLESVDNNDVPWGAVLNLKNVIDVKDNTFIKQLRYSREERGVLGLLSTGGQLRVLQTRKEYVEPNSEDDVLGSPEMLEIRKSFELERPYFDPDAKKKPDHRIVSFDWLNLGTTDLQARVIGLRANGDFEILQMPTTTAIQMSQMVPWNAPHRSDDPYLTLLNFKDPKEREAMLGPLVGAAVNADAIPFGPEGYNTLKTKSSLAARVKTLLESDEDLVEDLLAPKNADVNQIKNGNSVAPSSLLSIGLSQLTLGKSAEATSGKGFSTKAFSSRERHDQMHYASRRPLPASKVAHDQLDHVIRDRAKAGYLFNYKHNKTIVSEDPWLQDVWEWIAGAEEAAKEDGMVAAPLDLSYMGVYTVWTNSLGERPEPRIIQSSNAPDESQWEQLIATINKRNRRPIFDAVKTSKPQHRQLCLAICGLLNSDEELEDNLSTLMKEGSYTAAAAWALFEGYPKRAVEILNSGGNDLVFVAMALDIKLQNTVSSALPQTAWRKSLDENPKMANDPYLKAIYGYLTTGDWATIADETSLPLRHRVGIALRNFSDEKLTQWLEREMDEAVKFGDIEGIVLAGITENMVEILTKYVEKFGDYQTPILIMSSCYPRYLKDSRCEVWSENYRRYLNRYQMFKFRVKFDQETTKRSRQRDGYPTIKQPPRAITIRCVNCDSNQANDRTNSGSGSANMAGHFNVTPDRRNPLAATGINAGLCCPRCGSHLQRCAICLEIVGAPRSDRPELSTEPVIRRQANRTSFCLKCHHAQHFDHAEAWFARHVECPNAECQCQCMEQRPDPEMA